MTDCDSCKRYLESMEKGKVIGCYKSDYYSPGMIVYCRPQMLFGILWLDELEKGNWPPNPDRSSYTETIIVRGNNQAKFITAADFYSEITKRLETVPRDPKEALLDEIKRGNTDYELLSRPAKRVLNYISGWRRKRLSYGAWAKQVRYRHKGERSVG